MTDVGMGVVYEQFMLNRFFERIVKEHGISTALEAPVYGMAVFTGINSIGLARLGVDVTLLDTDKERLEIAKQAWEIAKTRARFVYSEKTGKLPFRDDEFDFAYNFAALWHVEDADKLLDEIARVSSNVVLICMPNPWNPGFLIRNAFNKLPKGKRWADQKRIEQKLRGNGMEIIESGVIDVPPWPDSEVPVKKILGGFGIKLGKKKWRWSILDYYSGKNPGIRKKAERYAFIEDSRLPAALKRLWAHHFYILAKKQ